MKPPIFFACLSSGLLSFSRVNQRENVVCLRKMPNAPQGIKIHRVEYPKQIRFAVAVHRENCSYFFSGSPPCIAVVLSMIVVLDSRRPLNSTIDVNLRLEAFLGVLFSDRFQNIIPPLYTARILDHTMVSKSKCSPGCSRRGVASLASLCRKKGLICQEDAQSM